MYINTIYGIAKEEDTLDGLLHPDIYAEDGTTDRFGAQYSEYSDAECYNADLSALLHELGPEIKNLYRPAEKRTTGRKNQIFCQKTGIGERKTGAHHRRKFYGRRRMSLGNKRIALWNRFLHHTQRR